jgi:predicted CDP-diglyceride synthetase/phosphatidate cytidylyltransferase
MDIIAEIIGSTMKDWCMNARLVLSSVKRNIVGKSKGDEVAHHHGMLDNMERSKCTDLQQVGEDHS